MNICLLKYSESPMPPPLYHHLCWVYMININKIRVYLLISTAIHSSSVSPSILSHIHVSTELLHTWDYVIYINFPC